MKVDWLKEREKVETLINNGVPYERIGKMYGVCGNSVKKAARKLNIFLPAKRKINPNEHFNKGKTKFTHPEDFFTCMNCGEQFRKKKNCFNKFCSNKCQMEYQKKEIIKKWLAGKYNAISGEFGLSVPVRDYMLEKNNYKCEVCGWGEVNVYTNKVPLHVHHIDGDYTNNKKENLQVLCPNCHSLTETYGSHNKRGRSKILKEMKENDKKK